VQKLSLNTLPTRTYMCGMDFAYKSPAQSIRLALFSLRSSSHATNFETSSKTALPETYSSRGPGLTRARDVSSLKMVVLQAPSFRKWWMHYFTEAGMSTINGVAAHMTTALKHVSESRRYF
jgi:hypothetical protein